MEVAAHYRIPHSEFLGWDADDRDKAIGWHLRQRGTCPHCRTRTEEWDPRRGGSRAAYQVTEAICPGCQLLGQARAAADRDTTKPPHGAYLTLRRRTEEQPGGDT